MEQVTIYEILHDLEKEDQDELYCKAFTEWMPEQRKILVTWWQSGEEYPYKLMILNKGKKVKQENFKYSTEWTTRGSQIMADYYGADWYKKSKSIKGLGKIHHDGIIYDGTLLIDYTEVYNGKQGKES